MNLMVSYEYSFPRILIDIQLIECHLSRRGEEEMCQKVKRYLSMVGKDLLNRKYKKKGLEISKTGSPTQTEV